MLYHKLTVECKMLSSAPGSDLPFSIKPPNYRLP